MLRRFSLLLITAVFFSVSIGAVLYRSESASAISGSEWRAGRIIDDNIFTDKSAMSVAQIQAFLDANVGTGGYDSVPGHCDTSGARSAQPFSSSSRAQYAASLGRPTTFTCLNGYYEVPKTTPGPGVPASNYGGAPIPVGARSAAQLIWDAAQANNISPKVLLVTIQKESAGPLTTDDWPFQKQYTYAMGAHCPDSGPGGSANCDANYAGFSIQISESASLMRWYLDNMSQPWWSYKKPGSNSILYNPNAGCGSSNVYIESRATAALYTYTPYQPNQAALNNMYGLGDSCSSYGNRNFWRIYSDWFGPTTSLLGGVTMTNIQQPNANPARGETVTYTYSLANNLAVPITLSAVGVVGRAGSITGPNKDFGWQGPVTLQPGTVQQFTFTTVVRDLGLLYVWPAVNYQGTYVQYNNWGITLASHPPNFSVSGITFTNPSPARGEDLGASFTVTNNSSVGVDIDGVGVVGRQGSLNGSNRDIGWQGATHFNAWETKSFTGFSRNITDIGPHYYWIGVVQYGNYMQYNNWGSTVNSHTPNFTLSQPLTINPTVPIYAGQNVTFNATLKNNEAHPIRYDAIGIPVKFYDRYSYDATWVGPGVLAAGAELPLTGTRNIDKPGPFTYWVSDYLGGTYTNLSSVNTFTSKDIAPNFSVSGLTFSNTTPAKGETLSASFTVTNNLPTGIDVDGVGVVGRFGAFNGLNRDLGWQGATHFNAGETKSFTGPVFSRIITEVGTSYYWIGVLYKGNYLQYNNWGSTIISHGP